MDFELVTAGYNKNQNEVAVTPLASFLSTCTVRRDYWRKGLSLGTSPSLWSAAFLHAITNHSTTFGKALRQMDTFEGESIEELREFLIPIATSIAMCRLAAVVSLAVLVYDWSKHHISQKIT